MTTRGRPRQQKGPRGKLAEQLRAARAARGLSQEQAAAELRIDRTTLARWETGWNRPRGPGLLFVEAWARAALGDEAP